MTPAIDRRPRGARTVSSRRSLALIVAAATALLAVLVAVAPGVLAGDDDRTRTYVIESEPPKLSLRDPQVDGWGVGDHWVFDAPCTAEDGRTGRLLGLLFVAAIREGADGPIEDRMGQMIFDLGDGNTIVVVGGSFYSERGGEMDRAREQVRVVAGGTGDFIGARGEVATVRNADGSYTHTFTLLEG